MAEKQSSIGNLNAHLRVLGEYILLAKLARGGMATVYVAQKNKSIGGLERLVAIKCCHDHLLEDENFVAMFLDEARLAGRIRHPNAVSTIDAAHDEKLYLVMDYVEGDTLAGILSAASKKSLRVPPGIAIRIAIDTLRGLHAAHELRGADGTRLDIVHRDVSPQNILVGTDGVTRITDFGIAHAASRSATTRTGTIKGKFAYVAPEQINGEKATRRIDIFSAGTVLWETLTCRRLFRRDDDAGTLGAVLKGSVPPPSNLSDVDESLDDVLFKAMRRDPLERYETAADFADALEYLDQAASTEEVAAYVEKVLGEKLEQRREVIRIAAEEPNAEWSLDTGESRSATSSKVSARSRVTHSEATPTVLDEPLSPNTGEKGTVRPSRNRHPLLPASFENNRARRLLAAVMLLLVGSALGLLLSSQNSDRSSKQVPDKAPSGKPGETERK